MQIVVSLTYKVESKKKYKFITDARFSETFVYIMPPRINF